MRKSNPEPSGGRKPTAMHVQQVEDAIELQVRGGGPDKVESNIVHPQFDWGEWPWIAGVLQTDLSGKDRLQSDIRSGAVPAQSIRPGTAKGALPHSAALPGPVQFLKKLIDTWKLEPTKANVLLGMDPEDGSLARDLLSGQIALRGRDARDRIACLYGIRKTLSALFRDETVENQWLREPHKMLNERSPMSLMLAGSMKDLLLVREYVEAVAGH